MFPPAKAAILVVSFHLMQAAGAAERGRLAVNPGCLARESFSTGEAAEMLGVTADTVRRWDRQGRIRTERDGGNRRRVPATEIDRLRVIPDDRSPSGPNRFNGVVTRVVYDGLLAQVELILTDPVQVVAVITRDAAEDLKVRAGRQVTAIVKSTSMMIEGAS